MQLVSIKDIGGSVVKDSDVYLVKDNKILNDTATRSFCSFGSPFREPINDHRTANHPEIPRDSTPQ